MLIQTNSRIHYYSLKNKEKPQVKRLEKEKPQVKRFPKVIY